MTRTVEQIEAELVRVAKWRPRCSHCGGERYVATPQFDLELLTADPNGSYAAAVMELLQSVYPPENPNGS